MDGGRWTGIAVTTFLNSLVLVVPTNHCARTAARVRLVTGLKDVTCGHQGNAFAYAGVAPCLSSPESRFLLFSTPVFCGLNLSILNERHPRMQRLRRGAADSAERTRRC